MENEHKPILNFHFQRLNIDEISVENCSDKLTLIEWKNEVEKDLAAVSMRINHIRQSPKTKENKNNLLNAQTYKKLLGMFHQRINMRLTQIRFEKPVTPHALSSEQYEERVKIKEESRTSFPWFFLEVAKEMLTMKQFTEIETEAYIRKNAAYEKRQKEKQ